MSKKVVLFGGGTGLSNVLSELKKFDIDISAVVTTADNGGSTGKIRNFYDIPAPGDLRRCALALSDDQSLTDAMNYRFDKNINNHTVGNLVLAAFTDIYGSMKIACEEYCKMLGVKQTVLPISDDSLKLCAKMESGAIIHGEHQISTYPEKIVELFYEDNPKILSEVIDEVNSADVIIFSCGSLYTSIIPNLLFEDLIKALDNFDGKIIYLCNLMTQRGETEKYKVSDHINAINRHLNHHGVDVVIANNNYDVDKNIISNYVKEKANLVTIDEDKIDAKILSDDLLIIDEDDHIRHNINKVVDLISKEI